jgi:hypothetical protein
MIPKNAPLYRLVVFEELDNPEEVRDLFCRLLGVHPTDANQWLARVPGVWPHPLPESETRALLDGLYVLGVAAEAWRADAFPDLSRPRTIHSAACLHEGFRVKGLRGEPTHWVPWSKVDLIGAGQIEEEDEYRAVSPQGWPSAVVTGLRAMVFRRPIPSTRRARATRIPRDPVGEVIIIRRDPRIALRVVENRMNYEYLGDRLRPSASENFLIFVADLCARADDAYITDSTRSFLEAGDPAEYSFPSSQALLDYATHRLLWSWYRRDRDAKPGGPEPTIDD